MVYKILFQISKLLFQQKIILLKGILPWIFILFLCNVYGASDGIYTLAIIGFDVSTVFEIIYLMFVIETSTMLIDVHRIYGSITFIFEKLVRLEKELEQLRSTNSGKENKNGNEIRTGD